MAKPKKAGKKAAKKASKKGGSRGKRIVPPAAPEQPRWGTPIKVGSIGPRVVTVREPLNQAAVDSLSEQEALALVLSVLALRLDGEMGGAKRLLGTLKGWAADDALRSTATQGGSA